MTTIRRPRHASLAVSARLAAHPQEGTVMSSTATYTVSGMTCSHCVSSVTEEVTKIPGVTEVKVDLASGAVTIASDTPVEDTAVKAAVDEAGYELVSH
jgi:copper chaperone